MTDEDKNLRVAGYKRTPQDHMLERLRELGVDARAEVRLNAVQSRSGYFRADIAIYRRDVIVGLVECKSHSRELVGRQRINYEGCGFPYMVAGHDNLDAAVAWCEAFADGAVR